MDAPAPDRLDPDQLRKRAKDLLKAYRAGDPDARKRVEAAHPRFADRPARAIHPAPLSLVDMQLVLARESGFASWPRLRAHLAAGGNAQVTEPATRDALFRAIAEGSVEGVGAALDAHPVLLAARDPAGLTPLLQACRYGRREVAARLLERGTDLTARDANGRGALEHALRSPHLQPPGEGAALARHLLQAGYPLDASALAAMGYDGALARLLDSDPAAASRPRPEGLFPLFNASELGRASAVELLLDRGADAGARDADGHLALYPALVRRYHGDPAHARIAGLLLAHGPAPDLACAALLGDAGRIRGLLAPRPVTPQLRPVGATPAHRGGRGARLQEALAWAAFYGHEAAALALMEGGARCTWREAARLGWLEALRKVLPSQSLTTGDWGDMLSLAAQNGKVPVAEYALAQGANLETGGDCTPLMWATWNGHADMVAFLLGRGASVRAHQNRQTALNWAIQRDHGSIARLLLEHGIDPEFRNDHGLTALQLAIIDGRSAIALILLDKGADAAATDPRGRDALALAREFGRKEVEARLMAGR